MTRLDFDNMTPEELIEVAKEKDVPSTTLAVEAILLAEKAKGDGFHHFGNSLGMLGSFLGIFDDDEFFKLLNHERLDPIANEIIEAVNSRRAK